MYRVLVTGATGFLGRYLVGRLIEKGLNISLLVRDERKTVADWRKVAKIYKGDITDKNILASMEKDIDVIFHLVAINIHKPPKTEEEKKYVYKVNVEGTRNLLEVFAPSLKHFIFSSSISVYDGVKGEDRLDESYEPRPDNLYGETKLVAERLIADYGRRYGFLTTSLRFPFIYGPGNKGNIFRMMEAIDKRMFVLVGRGGNVRNAIYAEDAAEAAISVAGKEVANGKNYIVTDGVDYTLKQLYLSIVESLGMKPVAFYLPYWLAKIIAWSGDVFSILFKKGFIFNSDSLARITATRRFSAQRFYDEIGFNPQYNFYNTINKTVDWYKENKAGKFSNAR